jgi:phage baseplate assembly protein W|tara:strand:- start:48 stop:476 length:429 start_codon:yes stop_codon:yes gene_type:complete
MAYVVGKKIIKDIDGEFDDHAYGFQLPANGSELFTATYTSYEAAKTNLRNLLLTARGERVMQPEFGTGLHELLFEQMSDDFEDRLVDTITESVNYWLPYINIDEINVELTDEMKDKNQVGMNIQFSIGNNIETDNVTFTLQG